MKYGKFQQNLVRFTLLPLPISSHAAIVFLRPFGSVGQRVSSRRSPLIRGAVAGEFLTRLLVQAQDG